MTFECLNFTYTWRSWTGKLPKSLQATQARHGCLLTGLLQNLIQSFLHFHGADGAGSMVDYGWCDTYSASSARLLDDQKRISRYEVGARCFLPISDPFQTCFRAGLPSSENGSLQEPASSVQKQQHADSAHSLLASKSISSQFIGINCQFPPIPTAAPSSAPLGPSILHNFTHTWRSWNGRLPKGLHGHLSITTCCRCTALGYTNTSKYTCEWHKDLKWMAPKD